MTLCTGFSLSTLLYLSLALILLLLSLLLLTLNLLTLSLNHLLKNLINILSNYLIAQHPLQLLAHLPPLLESTLAHSIAALAFELGGGGAPADDGDGAGTSAGGCAIFAAEVKVVVTLTFVGGGN